MKVYLGESDAAFAKLVRLGVLMCLSYNYKDNLKAAIVASLLFVVFDVIITIAHVRWSKKLSPGKHGVLSRIFGYFFGWLFLKPIISKKDLPKWLRAEMPFTKFFMIDSPRANAFYSFGHIGVTAGLYSHHPKAVPFVVAHEIGHKNKGHVLIQIAADFVGNIFVIFLGPAAGLNVFLLKDIPQKYLSRRHEYEADAYAWRLWSENEPESAKIEPVEEFFNAATPWYNKWPVFRTLTTPFATHPSPKARIAALKKLDAEDEALKKGLAEVKANNAAVENVAPENKTETVEQQAV